MYSYCFIFQGMEPIYLVWYIYYGLTGVIQACSMLNFWKHVAIAHFHGFFFVFFFLSNATKWTTPFNSQHLSKPICWKNKCTKDELHLIGCGIKK